ncbi:MAG: NAD(P)-binding protein, partial [Planctomycetota bacterium]
MQHGHLLRVPVRGRWCHRARVHDAGAARRAGRTRRPAVSAARVLDADVGIVGAGPAGMAAANVLAAAGLAVTVLDEGHRAGGQIFRQLPAGAA